MVAPVRLQKNGKIIPMDGVIETKDVSVEIQAKNGKWYNLFSLEAKGVNIPAERILPAMMIHMDQWLEDEEFSIEEGDSEYFYDTLNKVSPL